MHLGNILFLGTGNMGGGIMRGLLAKQVLPAGQIGMVEPSDAFAEEFTKQGVQRFATAAEAFSWATVALLCVKPQVFKTIAPEWRIALQQSGKRPEFISVMAGMTSQNIQEALGNQLTLSVLRTMPNLPMSIGQGTVALSGDTAPAALVEKGKAIFAAVATTVVVNESQLDAVTALAGSGPAWVFQFIEGLAQAGVRVGLSREISLALALSTIEGSTAMVKQSEKSPADLTAAVCSPGGTTICGLQALEEGAFRATIMKAVETACNRSKELGQ